MLVMKAPLLNIQPFLSEVSFLLDGVPHHIAGSWFEPHGWFAVYTGFRRGCTRVL